MKRFDVQAIIERIVNILQKKSHWNHLQEDGATYQLIESFSEPVSEVARYGEYLLGELKWDTSRNFSSTKHMARLVGKKLERKHSAVGTILVSHSDVNGVPRYAYLGVDNFSADSESDFDNLEQDTNLSATAYTHALVPWTDSLTYKIKQGNIFTTKDDIPFICAESREIKTCNVTWNTANTSQKTLNSFKASDGWLNYKYLIVPVVQGVQKEVILGTSDNTAGQTFTIATLDIEAADSYYTRDFCYVSVLAKGSEEPIIYHETQHLQNCTNTDEVFEINILDDLSGTQIKFGDGVCGKIPPKDSVITIHYLETKGSAGNVTELYNFRNEILGAELPTSTKFRGLSIGCQNMWCIVGGTDLETLKEFKANSETAYAKNYKILHTFTELEEQINRYSPIPLIKVHTSSFLKQTKVNSTYVYKNYIGVTGLTTGMNKLSNLEQTVFETVLNAELNEKILSNKYVTYISPEIVRIDSTLETELKNSVLNQVEVTTDLVDHLQSRYGKACLDPVDCYMQSDLIKASLEHYSNIGSISNVSLFTTDLQDFSYGQASDGTECFLFKFQLPSLLMDRLSREGYCDKSLSDGNALPYIFNVAFAGNTFTFIITEANNSVTGDAIIYEEDTFFNSNRQVPYTLYGSVTDNNAQRYNIKQLLKPQKTFNRLQLSNPSSLDTTTIAFKKIGFNISRSSTQPIFYLLLDAETVSNYLGFVNYDIKQIKTIYTGLLTSIDSGYSKATVSFEPVDKTVNTDWSTVMYYDNINIEISN